MLAFAVHVSAKSVSQTITFSGTGVPLKILFAEVEKQTGFTFVYSHDQISVGNTVTIDAYNTPLNVFFG